MGIKTIKLVCRRGAVVKLIFLSFFVCCMTYCITMVNHGTPKSRLMNSMNLPPNLRSAESYFERFMVQKIDLNPQFVDPNDICSNKTNLTNVVHQYRSLVQKMIALPPDESYVPNEKEVCLLPTDILEDERFHVMVDRVRTIRAACRKPSFDLTAEINPLRLLQDKRHHIIMCRNPKVASTTLGIYANVLHIYTVMDTYLAVLRGITDHFLLRRYTFPAASMKEIRHVERTNDLAFPTVRHPFQRTLSAYINKVKKGHHYSNRTPELYQEMLKYTKMNPSEAKAYMKKRLSGNDSYVTPIKTFKCDHDLKTFDGTKFDKDEMNSRTKPSFRGFVLAISETILQCRNDLDCLLEIEIHYRGQGVKCSTCDMKYDAVVKSETLREDIEFIERLLQFPPVYEVQLKLMATNRREIWKNSLVAENEESMKENMRANISPRDRSYDEYMSELTKDDMDILYTAYYGDFTAFGYDPCEEL